MIPTELQEDFEYIENFLSEDEADELMKYLIEETNWEEREITLFGKTYMQPRLIKWFGEREYTYSNERMRVEMFPGRLDDLRLKLEENLGCKFNSVLLNYYRDGNDSMGRHSDDEKELGTRPIIASISLGVQRDFVIVEKLGMKRRYVFPLENGSLLVMKEDSQKLYAHELPKRKKVKEGRINLTFRYVY